MSANQALSDRVSGGGSSAKTQIYHLQALGLLRERIATAHELLAVSDPTIMTIVILAIASEIFHSDYSSMQSHLDGLQKIVAIRGGLQSLGSPEDQLSAKICRLVSSQPQVTII